MSPHKITFITTGIAMLAACTITTTGCAFSRTDANGVKTTYAFPFAVIKERTDPRQSSVKTIGVAYVSTPTQSALAIGMTKSTSAVVPDNTVMEVNSDP